jgi:hypothetical protein
MMCPRGGSKGGKHFADTSQNVTDINVGNKATQKYRTWHTVCPRFRRKATQWKKYPLGLFYCQNGANLKATEEKEKRIAMLPSREDKDIIDLLSRQGIPGSNYSDILQPELTPAIPDGGEVRNGHTNGRSQILALVAMSTHNLIQSVSIHQTHLLEENSLTLSEQESETTKRSNTSPNLSVSSITRVPVDGPTTPVSENLQ